MLVSVSGELEPAAFLLQSYYRFRDKLMQSSWYLGCSEQEVLF